ncbi:response regulator [bacterium]|nr:response regulator [bacterium]
MEKKTNTRILLIDPEPERSIGLQRELKRSGFELILAQNGDEAMFLAKQHQPSLILAELNLPQFNGPNLLHAIRATASLRATPFIFLSEQPKVEERIRVLRLQPDDYIRKPYHIEEVIARIQMLLHEKPGVPKQAGELNKFSLLDLLQIMRLQAATGVLKLKRDSSSGEIRLKNGEIITAKCGIFSTLSALKKMTTWTFGSYFLIASEPPDENQPLSDLTFFWQTAPGRLIKWRELLKKFPPLTAIPAFSKSDTRDLSPATVALLKGVDNKRSFAEILEKSGDDELSTLSLLSSMLKKNILLIRKNPVALSRKEDEISQAPYSLKNRDRLQNINKNEVDILSRFFQSQDKFTLSTEPLVGSQTRWNGVEPNSRHIQLTKGELMLIREHLRS